ncbi:MAG: hypothetical protein IPP66_05925 [Anaerolineales bacterium]|nr:hypothetical protein [Anaerolineales bacterium]
MNITLPSRETFWRAVFLASAALPFLSIWQSINLGRSLEIDVFTRPSWIGLLAGLFLLGLTPLLAWTLSWSRLKERLLAVAESSERFAEKFRWVGWPLLVISIIGYTVVFMLPSVRNLFGDEGWIRFLIFWYFSLLGLFAIKTIRRDVAWFASLLAVVLFQTVFHLLAVQFSYVTNYPFAMGWSETSRYYYPSLFFSKHVYGQEYPWPILHPTLHLLLSFPYLVEAPLWVHRLWQVVLRLVLVAAVVPAMMKRLSVTGKVIRWFVALWMFLYLFMGPLYFHLAIPVILLLYGFSSQDDRKNWLVVLIASIWCGWSRVNWYPMPGVIAAVLYLLEVPFTGKNIWGYSLKPTLWFIVGTLTAFISQRVYIVISGVSAELFYTSLSSNLLWYRLLPNASYFLGVLPAAVLASLAMWLVLYLALRGRRNSWHPIRLLALFAALLALFIGGLVVSLKIGGGADLHNFDGYWVLLLLVAGYLTFARYRREDGQFDEPVYLHWLVVVLLFIVPVWSQLGSNAGIKTYDVVRTQSVLSALQTHVDDVNAKGGETLFITQRQLISMHMLKDVTLVPEYEREDLMEIAMANNTKYLALFQTDMEKQRFALIVVDPLNYSIYSRRREFSDENNVWARHIMKSILCNYRLDSSYPEDGIALYVPQEGERQCP